ncbi:MAG: 4Fe-4S binding protein [Lachnospira eligens]
MGCCKYSSRTTVNVRANKNIAETACTLCGQCVSNCPRGCTYRKRRCRNRA